MSTKTAAQLANFMVGFTYGCGFGLVLKGEVGSTLLVVTGAIMMSTALAVAAWRWRE